MQAMLDKEASGSEKSPFLESLVLQSNRKRPSLATRRHQDSQPTSFPPRQVQQPHPNGSLTSIGRSIFGAGTLACNQS